MTHVLPGQREPDAHPGRAGEAQTTRPTILDPAPEVDMSGGSPTPPPTDDASAPGEGPSAEDKHGRDHRDDGALSPRGPARNDPPAIDVAAPVHAPPAGYQHGRDQATDVSQSVRVAAGRQRVAQSPGENDHQGADALDDPLLYLAAVSLDDLEKVRIAAENRLRQLTRDDADADGEERGFGLDADNPQVRAQQSIVDGLSAMEHGAELALKRRLRQHPLHEWIKGTVGVGEKQAARLLAAVGDPYFNTLHDRPRTVSELWAYAGYKVVPAGHSSTATQARSASGPQDDSASQSSCADQDAHAGGAPNIPADHSSRDAHGSTVGGEQSSTGQGSGDTRPSDASGGGDGDPGHAAFAAQSNHVGVAVRRRKGQRANWSTVAKMRAYLIAESCIKQARSPYRVLYEQRRAHTAVTHPEWTAGHSHNDALRIVAKGVLRDLWRAARDVHLEAAP